MEILKNIASGVNKGDEELVHSLTSEALEQKIPVQEILNLGLVAGMNVVGEKFKKNEVFIPEVLVSARAMKAGMVILKPLLLEAKVKSRGKVVIGTVQGDLHDIGKNIVAMLLEGAGFEIIDLGADVPVENFIASVKKEQADIVGMSALLTTTMGAMKAVIEGLKEINLKDNVKIMIGGAPVTQSFADRIESDGYAPDAAAAIDLAFSLIEKLE